MSGPLVTVIIPTFDHQRTLEFSIPSVLAQTHTNLELFVIGDGAPSATREIVESFAAGDERVTYLAFDKGERNGEAHRHGVLMNEARGEYVFYCGDDDLWLPDHVETMLARFAETGANFVCCQPCWIRPDGQAPLRWVVDLARDWYRDELLAGRNRVPLNCGAHSMELYRALPHGWRTTPKGMPTDLYMWQQLLEHSDCRAASTHFTTVIGLPASQRPGRTADDRIDELGAWSPTTDIRVREKFYRAAQRAEFGLLDQARMECDAQYLGARLAEHVDLVHERDAHYAGLVADLQAQIADLQAYIELMSNSRAWRAAERARSIVRRPTVRT
jgi:glycosyltransferase involved in cell wall biosynthesis